jgi:hypothetical protein
MKNMLGESPVIDITGSILHGILKIARTSSATSMAKKMFTRSKIPTNLQVIL